MSTHPSGLTPTAPLTLSIAYSASAVTDVDLLIFSGELWRPPSGSSANAFLFEGKERLTADGIREWDYCARRYCSMHVPFFTTPDPLAEKTPWLSPYIFCAANPVMNIDPTGMYVIDNDQIMHNFREYIKTQISTLKEFNSSDASTATAIAKAVKYFEGVLNEISALENSEQGYYVKYGPTPGEGGIDYSTTTGLVQIAVGSNFPGIVAHELHHGYQFESGEISIGIEDVGGLYDLTDEIKAYNRQNAVEYGVEYFKNHSLTVDAQEVLGKKDSKNEYIYLKIADKKKSLNLKSKQGRKMRTGNKGKSPDEIVDFYIGWQKDL